MMLGMRMVMGSSVKDRIQQIRIRPPSLYWRVRVKDENFRHPFQVCLIRMGVP